MRFAQKPYNYRQTMQKKVLVICPIFPSSLEDDTIVPFVAQFCYYFGRKHPEITLEVLSLKYPIDQDVFSINTIKIHSIKGGFQSKIGNLKTLYKGYKKAKELHRKNSYDAILSFWYLESAILGKLLHKKYNIPHCIWLQGQDVKFSNKYLRYFHSKNDRLICVGKNHAEILKREHHICANAIANVAIDTSNISLDKKTERCISILGVGNLGTLKNYSLWITIVAKLHKEFPNLKAVLCGDGPEKEKLQSLIQTHNLEDCIRLKGYVSNREVRQLMQQSKIFLHPSLFEGNSFAIQEALFMGCKVISTFPIGESLPNFHHIKKESEILAQIKSDLQQDTVYDSTVGFDISETAATIYHNLFPKS